MIQTRVMIIEDEELIATLLAEVLETLGYTVSAIAATETEAVTVATHNPPDLMIVDVYLGEGSGISAVAEITKSVFVPHVFMTGDRRHVEAYTSGAIVLQKPFGLDALKFAIARASGRFHNVDADRQ